VVFVGCVVELGSGGLEVGITGVGMLIGREVLVGRMGEVGLGLGGDVGSGCRVSVGVGDWLSRAGVLVRKEGTKI